MLTYRFGLQRLASAILIALPGMALAADPLQIKICPSQDKAEQIIQSKGNLMPDGCRVATITRVNSAVGPICQIDLAQNDQSTLNKLRNAVTTTQWWTACDNLQAP